MRTLEAFDPLQVLRQIVGGRPTTAVLRHLGKRLARIVRRDEAFTDSYLFNVLAVPPKQNIGKPLALALRAYWMERNGVRPAIAGACEPVTVRAIPGTVEQAAIIVIASKRCANDRCMAPFIGYGKYCCPSCRAEARNQRRRKAATTGGDSTQGSL